MYPATRGFGEYAIVISERRGRMIKNDKVVLENADLLVEIASHGGELVRIYDKNHSREILWEGKPEIWGRHSPILFPFIGRCANGVYHYQ